MSCIDLFYTMVNSKKNRGKTSLNIFSPRSIPESAL
jgi:hypothetical protein